MRNELKVRTTVEMKTHTPHTQKKYKNPDVIDTTNRNKTSQNLMHIFITLWF